ncbi:hypothetical protein L345_07447, partial [Ophiophagus hannah]
MRHMLSTSTSGLAKGKSHDTSRDDATTSESHRAICPVLPTNHKMNSYPWLLLPSPLPIFPLFIPPGKVTGRQASHRLDAIFLTTSSGLAVADISESPLHPTISSSAKERHWGGHTERAHSDNGRNIGKEKDAGWRL